jgi:hypothetical protein
VKIEWFGDNLLASGVQGREDRRAHIVGGHSQDRHFLERWVGAEPRGDFPTIDTGHTEVKQNQNWLALARKPNRFIAVGGLNDSKTKVVEQKSHNRPDIGRIVGDQDGGA